MLVTGSTGAMGGGQFGTALSAVQTAHHSGREVHALVAEGRPGSRGRGSRHGSSTQAGVPHAVVTDAAAPGYVSAGDVQAVLVAADRVAANGDVIALAGAYPLALAAHEAGVPFLACATTTAFDPGLATGADATLEEGRPGPVARVAGTRITPEATVVRNRTQDLVPARLVTAIVTEQEVIRRPDTDGVAPVLARLAAAAAPVEPAAPAPARPAAPAPPPATRRGSRLMATVAVGSRGSLVARSTADRILLREYLEHDRLFAAYAICDLGEREFPRTRWGIATDRRPPDRGRDGVRRPHAAAAVRDGRRGRDRRDPARHRPAASGLRRGEARAACRPSPSTTAWTPARR